MFNIKQNIHLELDEFTIPDSQIFDNIVKEDEILCVKMGKYILKRDNYLASEETEKIESKLIKNNNKQDYKSEFSNSLKPTKFIKKEDISSEKIINRIRKKQESDSSSSSEVLIKNKAQKYISETSESSSSSEDPPVKKRDNVIAKPKATIPIKSILIKQPEPEYIPKILYNYNIQDFEPCAFESVAIQDEILFKSLEIRDDFTPGMSEFKVI